MSNALKMALVVGVVIAVETLVLRQLFLGFPRGVFVGAFLFASILLVFLQHLLMKRWLTRILLLCVVGSRNPNRRRISIPVSIPCPHQYSTASRRRNETVRFLNRNKMVCFLSRNNTLRCLMKMV
jgi:hypothetical protein